MRENFRKAFRDGAGKKNGALVKTALPGAALGGSGQFLPRRIEDIGGNRLKKTGGVILFGGGGGEATGDSGIEESRSDRCVDGAVGRKRPCRGQGMVRRENHGVGEIPPVLHQASAGIASHKRCGGRDHRVFLEVPQGNAGLCPGVDPENGAAGVAEQGLVDRHIFKGGESSVEEKTTVHC